MTFIVRVEVTSGRITGVVERVKSGAKQVFHDAASLGLLIEQMAVEEAAGEPLRGPLAST